MLYRSKWAVLGQFLLYSIIPFLVAFFLIMTLRDFIFEQFISVNTQFYLIQFMNISVVYGIMYIFWDIILMFTLLILLNTIFAKILNIEVEKVLVITLIALISGFIIYHTVIFIWFYISDPLHLNGDFMTYFNAVLDNETVHSSDLFTNLMEIMFDLLIKFFYSSSFGTSPTLINYFVVYSILKGFVSDAPFKAVGFGFNFFHYDIWFIFIIYLAILIPLFIRFVKGCECITDKEIQEYKQQKSKEEFGQQENVIGEYTIKKPTKQSTKKPTKQPNKRGGMYHGSS